jgi:hypothetical protein
LLAKSSITSTSITSLSGQTPIRREENEENDGDDDHQPRGGLGLGFSRREIGAGSPSGVAGIGSSKLNSELAFHKIAEAEGSSRGGAFGMLSRMSAIFASATSQAGVVAEEMVQVDSIEKTDDKVMEDVKETKKSKKGKERGNKAEDSRQVEETVQKKKKRKDKDRPENSEELPVEEKDEVEDRPGRKKKKKVKVYNEIAADASTGQSNDDDADVRLPKKEKKIRKSNRRIEEATEGVSPKDSDLMQRSKKKRRKDATES